MPERHNTGSQSHPHRVTALQCLRQAALAGLMLAVPALAVAQAATLDEAVAQAQRKVPGKLVAATTVKRDGQLVYRIRILGADGVVRTIIIESSAR